MSKVRKSQFPSISRIITENKIFSKVYKSAFKLANQAKFKKFTLFSLAILTSLIIIILIYGISILGLKIYKNLIIVNRVNAKREKIQSQINFWTSVSDKYPGYKDSYFRIAELEYSL